MATPTTRAFEIVNSDKLNKLASRFTKPETTPDSAPQPPPKNDLYDRLNIEQRIQLDTGFDLTIDVQPDFRFIILSLIFHVNKLYALLEQKQRPLLTPPSLIGYCLYLIYGFFLVCDKHGRHTPSQYAREFLNDSDGQQILETLLRSYVPPFVLDILRGLAPTVLPRRPGIEFVPTFAGFSFHHDFGRFIPPQVFTIAHTLAASTRSNIDPDQVLTDWFESNIVIDTDMNIKVGHFLGAGIQDNGRYENWFQSACISIFNPVVLRSLSQRPTFQRVSYTPHTTAPMNINPYELNLNSSVDNVPLTVSFLESLSDLVKHDLSASFQLGGIFSTISGINIVTHAYSDVSLPTWHYKSLGSHTVPKSAKEFASAISFMTLNIIDSKTKVSYPSDDSTITKFLYLVRNQDRNPKSDPDRIVRFSPRDHIYSPWRLFDPFDYLPSKFAFPIVCGLLIESNSLDGFSIPHPNLRSSLREDNSQILQSAVPLYGIRKATSHFADPTVRRTITRDDKQKVSLSFYDMARNRLGIVDQTVADSALPSQIPGFNLTNAIYRFNRMFSKLSYRTNDTHPIPSEFIHAWSSYRHVLPSAPRVDDDTSIDLNKVYMLLDFRTVFGTDVTLAQTEHGAKLIPLA